jgi:predicted PurR-regulated permease PerM
MAFLTAFFFFFICTGWGRVRAFWFSLIPERRQGRAVDLLGQMDAVIAGFVRGRLTIMLIQCVIFSVGYLIIGTPAAIILGVIVGVLSIVPYLALVGIPISIVLMLLAVDPSSADTFRGQWWWMVFAPIGVYMIGQAADDYLLTPLIQGKSTGLDTPTVLFASLAGGVLAGFYGLLVAIPVAACIKILIREIVWPKFRDWAEGRAADPLPIGGGDKAE